MSVYLDHNASARPSASAVRAAAEWLGRGGNPSAVHASGRAAKAAVEGARAQVAEALGAAPRDLIFTSGATESLHLAVAGRVGPGAVVLASAVEHPALYGACDAVGAQVRRVPVDARGQLRVEDFVEALTPEVTLVALMAAQNEIGALYPVAEVAAAVAPVPVLCDAVQAVGKVPWALDRSGCALAAVSGHKIGAPTGVGVLWVRPGVAWRPTRLGGPQERGRRAGTESVASIVGFGAAAAALPQRLAEMPRLAALRADLVIRLRRIAGFTVHGAPGLPNTLSFRVDGVDGDVLLQALDLEGFELSSGAACSSGALTPSPVLSALGLTERQARGALRLSMGPQTTAAELCAFAEALPRLVRRARGGR